MGEFTVQSISIFQEDVVKSDYSITLVLSGPQLGPPGPHSLGAITAPCQRALSGFLLTRDGRGGEGDEGNSGILCCWLHHCFMLPQ